MSIFLDFDGTITAKDTISVLAAISIAENGPELRPNLSSAWADIVKHYEDDYLSYVKSYEPPENARDTVAEESAFLQGLRNVDMQSVARVSGSGLFCGLNPAKLFELGRSAAAAGKVEIRPGFAQLVAQSIAKGWEVSVVSVNWSETFIRGVLSTELGKLGDPKVGVASNEITASGEILGPKLAGRIEHEPLLCTSSDKLRFTELLARGARSGDPAVDASPLVLYFGDSVTDLECLLHWPHSVVMTDKDDSTILRTLQRLNYSVFHILGASSPLPPRSLVWARDFKEVLASSFFVDVVKGEQTRT